MSRYIRPCRAGATVSVTVALAQRGSRLLVAEVERLRQAVRDTRAERPFASEGEERPENGPVDRFQRRTGEAPAAKPITSATRRISRRIYGIAGSIRSSTGWWRGRRTGHSPRFTARSADRDGNGLQATRRVRGFHALLGDGGGAYGARTLRLLIVWLKQCL